jgi:branched-chain amino acid transport system substrate-binding protein
MKLKSLAMAATLAAAGSAALVSTAALAQAKVQFFPA